MDEILRGHLMVDGYDVNEVTWFYLSLPLIIAIFFRFTRVFSLRNLDLVLILLLSPVLLQAYEQPAVGYLSLFALSGVLLIRLFCDGLLSRRPHLEQNLNVPGLAFLCASTFVFLSIAALRIDADEYKPTVELVQQGEQLLNRENVDAEEHHKAEAGPASRLVAASAGVAADLVGGTSDSSPVTLSGDQLAARILAILAHLAVVVGLLVMGRRHFGDTQAGLAMATLYLLLPCTAYEVEKFNHVLPAALILWAFIAYRRPAVAGGLMGFASGALLFPVFLLPLWGWFYGRRGAAWFFGAVGGVMVLLLGSFALTSASTYEFVQQTMGSIELLRLQFRGDGANGFWSMYDPVYRIPVMAAFVIMLVMLTVWPKRKSLEHLIAHSTAIVVGTQFWYPQQGGVYLVWYLPLLLLVVFRPRLSHVLPPEVGRSATHRAVPVEERKAQPASAGSMTRQFFR